MALLFLWACTEYGLEGPWPDAAPNADPPATDDAIAHAPIQRPAPLAPPECLALPTEAGAVDVEAACYPDRPASTINAEVSEEIEGSRLPFAALGPVSAEGSGSGRALGVVRLGDGVFRLVDAASGATRWEQPIDMTDAAVPVVNYANLGGPNGAYLVSGDQELVALDASTGAQLWRSTFGGPRPAVADLDGDGVAEVVVGLSAEIRVLSGATGRELARTTVSGSSGAAGGLSIITLADIDLDGGVEMVVGNAVFHADGTPKWQVGTPDGFAAVADFDGDRFGEVVSSAHAVIRLFDDDGVMLWEVSPEVDYQTSGPPSVADVDGDGLPEVFVSFLDALRVFGPDGALRWAAPLDENTAIAGSSIVDLDGDGSLEVLTGDQTTFRIFDASTGRVLFQSIDHHSDTGDEYPTPVDLDGDGEMEVLVPNGDVEDRSPDAIGFTIFRSSGAPWAPGPLTWNQHAFWQGNVDDETGVFPAHPVMPWLTHNSFRAWIAPGAAAEGADAVLDLAGTCVDACDDGVLYVVVRVGNAGAGRLPYDLPVTAYAWQGGVPVEVATLRTQESVPSGHTTTGLVFALDPADLVDGVLELRVDEVDAIAECREDNNVLVVTEGLCP